MKHLFFALAAVIVFAGCGNDHDSTQACGFCPNNTECMLDECGCPDENTFDMGSWCMPKHENLFVAEMLGCPCFETFGLILLDMEPVDSSQGEVIISGSSFSMTSRENTSTGFQSNGMLVYDLPGGDSIVLFAMPLPKAYYPTFCQVDPNTHCWANLHGKFHGPDTIRATIQWGNCSDNNGNATTFEQTYPVLLTRWE